MTDPTLTPEVYGPDHASPSGLAVAKARADSAAKREPIASVLPSSVMHNTARYLADHCLVAFWMETDGRDASYFRGRARDDLHLLADLFGYRLEAK